MIPQLELFPMAPLAPCAAGWCWWYYANQYRGNDHSKAHWCQDAAKRQMLCGVRRRAKGASVATAERAGVAMCKRCRKLTQETKGETS